MPIEHTVQTFVLPVPTATDLEYHLNQELKKNILLVCFFLQKKEHAIFLHTILTIYFTVTFAAERTFSAHSSQCV